MLIVLVIWLQTNHLLAQMLNVSPTQEILLLNQHHLPSVLAVVLERDIIHTLGEQIIIFRLNLISMLLPSHHL